MAVRDELTAALTPTWNKRLATAGFRRVGRRDLQSISNGIVRLFNFQVSSWGSRDFCVNVAAYSLAGNDHPILSPGFRLAKLNGSDLWLPSRTGDEARQSAEMAWSAAEATALPWFERNATLDGHLGVLRGERWRFQHHLHFQIGVVEAMLGQNREALMDLTIAKRLYAQDARTWAHPCVAKSALLIEALHQGTERALLDRWTESGIAGQRGRRQMGAYPIQIRSDA